MSRTTIARRYNVATYSETEKQQLIGHLIAKTQPMRRVFLGKTENFKDKEDRVINTKMLKAYLKGQKYFFHGTMPKEIMRMKFNKELGKEVPVGTGVFQEVPKPNLVLQMYFFS